MAVIGCQYTLCVKNIQSAYRKKTLKDHPDKGGNEEAFEKLGNAVDRAVLNISVFLKQFPQYIPSQVG